MLTVIGLVLATVFAGVAVYVLLVEHPARRALDPAGQVAQWQPSYARGAVMQAGAAALGAVAGIVNYVRWENGWTLAGALCLLAAIGWTFAAMWRLNGRIKATTPAAATADTVALLDRWGRLHGVRTLIGLAALGCFAVAAYRAVSA